MNENADLAVLVSQILPEGADRIGLVDGVWVCDYHALPGLAPCLRDGLMRVSETRDSQQNRGDKMTMLYDYLTGNEFKMQLEAIMDGFMTMKNAIGRERLQMEKIWKEREKQLEKVLLNTNSLLRINPRDCRQCRS